MRQRPTRVARLRPRTCQEVDRLGRLLNPHADSLEEPSVLLVHAKERVRARAARDPLLQKGKAQLALVLPPLAAAPNVMDARTGVWNDPDLPVLPVVVPDALRDSDNANADDSAIVLVPLIPHERGVEQVPASSKDVALARMQVVIARDKNRRGHKHG